MGGYPILMRIDFPTHLVEYGELVVPKQFKRLAGLPILLAEYDDLSFPIQHPPTNNLVRSWLNKVTKHIGTR